MARRLKSMLTDDLDTCYLCSRPLAPGEREIHHIFRGSNRVSADRYGLIVPLCANCHRLGKNSVHNNIGVLLCLQAEGQNEFERQYGSAEFMSIFGRDYIEKYKQWREDNGLV